MSQIDFVALPWQLTVRSVSPGKSLTIVRSAFGESLRDELCLEVALSDHDFVGSNPEVWIDGSELKTFTTSLAAVDRDRAGSAILLSMSPEEFEFEVQVIDRAGHVAVAGMLARHRWGRQRGHYLNTVSNCFPLEPTELPSLLDAFQQLNEVPP